MSLITRAARLRRANRERQSVRGQVELRGVPAKLPAVTPPMAKPMEQVPELFKLYEEAAEKTKAHAWSQTTWVLALNAGIIAFSLNFFASHGTTARFVLIEGIAAGVGVVLCLFLIYLHSQLGAHISHYWTVSNQLASASPALVGFLSRSEVAAARAGRRASFPAFCRRLQFLAALFAAAHAGWFAIVAGVLGTPA